MLLYSFMGKVTLDDTNVHVKLPNPVPETDIPTDKIQLTSCQLSVQTYWDSPDARNTFLLDCKLVMHF